MIRDHPALLAAVMDGTAPLIAGALVDAPVEQTRAVAFLDLCGFSAYTRTRGDRAAAREVAALRGRLRAAATRRGIDIIMWTGDGAMIAGRDADSVKSCATEVVIETAARGALALRGGIAEGPVLSVDGGDLIGATVNRAAELCDESQPHEVLIDRGPRRRVASRGAAASTPARMIASLLRVRR